MLHCAEGADARDGETAARDALQHRGREWVGSKFTCSAEAAEPQGKNKCQPRAWQPVQFEDIATGLGRYVSRPAQQSSGHLQICEVERKISPVTKLYQTLV
jgi:hypothetical protein